MDNFEYSSPESDLQSSTESILIFEYSSTMNPSYIQENVNVSDSSADELNGLYVFYGMGGILVFFVVYMVCYAYFMHLKEKIEERVIELRRLNERVSRAYRRPPINEGRIFIEDFHEETINPNSRLPWKYPKDSHVNNEHENRGSAVGENQEPSNIGDVHIPFRTPEEVVERKFFPEDFEDLLCTDAVLNQATESFTATLQTSDSQDGKYGWLSTPPLCFSSPKESKEKIFYPEEFKDCNPNTTQLEKCENLEDQKSCENTTTTLSKGTVSKPSPRRSRSSPTSPDVVRRRLPTTECTPRRPFSWR